MPPTIVRTLAVALLAVGCIAVPELDPDVVGSGELAHSNGSHVAAHLASNGSAGPYRIGPLDELTVQVWGRPDLGSQTPLGDGRFISVVREDGTVFMPLLGRVPVQDQTLAEVSKSIGQRYRQVVDNAEVEVQLVRCRSQAIDVFGEVAAPGRQFLCSNQRTIGDAITLAGGLTPQADAGRGMLMRGESSFPIDPRSRNGTRTADLVLEAGDGLYFPTLGQRSIYVLGEVEQPGPQTIPAQGLSLIAALAGAQGLDKKTAKFDTIFLVRSVDGKRVTHRIGLSEIIEGPEIQLADGDRIYVPPTRLARWSRWWTQALPSFLFPRATID
jgi:polysaccharide export outer membrane protein